MTPALPGGPASDFFSSLFSPLIDMKPLRHASPNDIQSPARTFFVTTKTSMGRRLLQSERDASLFIDVPRSYLAAKKFQIHDFVVMPDHAHLLLTVGPEMTIERAMQLIKGEFSYRLKKETGYSGLNDAAEEIRALKEEVAALKSTERVQQDLEWVEDGGFWVRKSEKGIGSDDSVLSAMLGRR